MADLTDFDVTAPDGSTITFRGPSSMSDEQVRMRAAQEWAFKTGKIPTTYGGGVKQSVGETLADQSKPIAAAAGLTGVVTGQPELVAAAPLAGRAVQAAGEYIAGRPITPTSASEIATLAGEGAIAGYGPQVAAKSLEWAAARTVPHQLPSGQWVKGIKGEGVMPWAVRTAGEAASAVADKLHGASKGLAAMPSAVALSQSGEALKADLQTLMTAVESGTSPAQAAAKIAKGNPRRFGQLMTAYVQARQVK